MQRLSVSVTDAPAAEAAVALLVFLWFEGDGQPAGAAAEVERGWRARFRAALGRGDFVGRKDEVAVLYPRDGEVRAERVLLVGLGPRQQFSVERLRRAAGVAVRQAQRLGAPGLGLVVPAGTGEDAARLGQAAAEGAVLAAWEP